MWAHRKRGGEEEWGCRRGEREGGGVGVDTLQAGDEAVMQGVQLQLAGAYSLRESLLAACCTGQAHIAPHLCQPLIKALLHLIHTSIGRLKVLLQSDSQSVVV